MALRQALTVAKGELLRSRGRFRPRNLLVAIALAALLALPASMRPAAELYTLSVEGNPDLAEAAGADGRFAFVAQHSRADVSVRGEEVSRAPTEKGLAALEALAQAARTRKISVLRATGDLRAFPVEVEVRFLERAPPALAAGGPATTPAPPPTPEPTAAPRVERGGGPSLLPPAGFVSTPAELQPPLPFGAMLLSFLFLFPGYFAAQLGSSAVFAEKVRRQGEVLFASPLGAGALAAGKLLPLGLAAGALMAVEAAGLFRSPAALAALGLVLPLLLFLLAAALAAGVLARSHPELTALTLALTIAGSVLLLIPTLFLGVHPAASASPFSPVVRLLEGDVPAPGEVAAPVLLLGALTASLLLLMRPLLEPELFFARLSPLQRLGASLRTWLGAGRLLRFAGVGLLLAPLSVWPLLGFEPLLPLPAAWPILLAVLLLQEVAKGAPVAASGSLGLKAGLQGVASGLGLGAGAALLVFSLHPNLPHLLLMAPVANGLTGGWLGLGLGLLGRRALLPLALASASIQVAVAQWLLELAARGLYV